MIVRAAISAILVTATMCSAPARADPNAGLISVCRLPYEHHKQLAKIPKGSTFIQSYPTKVLRPRIDSHPATYVLSHAAGYIVKTLDDATVAPAPACTTIRAAIVSQPPGDLSPDVPRLAKGSQLLQQFNDPATAAQFKTEVVDGFK